MEASTAKNRPTKVKSIYESFLPNAKARFKGRRKFPEVKPSELNTKQRLVYDELLKYLEGQDETPFRMVVAGAGGTGKSFILQSLRSLLLKYKMPFRVMSFTGAAAYLVGGQTFHSTLHFPYYYRGGSADPNHGITQARNSLKGVKFLIVDEMSLCGLHMLGYIDNRLRLIFKTQAVLANLNFILMGDFSQIKPICDTQLFRAFHDDSYEPKDYEIMGVQAYATFNRAVVLDEQMRVGASERAFRSLLNRVRRGRITEADVEKLNERYIENLTDDEVDEFTEKAIALTAEREPMAAYNSFRLKQLGSPVYSIPSINSRNTPKTFSNILNIAVGAKCLLNSNLAIPMGLFNGSIGTVTQIIGSPDNVKAIMVEFPTYIGPPFLLGKSIPIVRVKKSEPDDKKEANYTFDQFPLEICFSITTHRVQGSTLSHVLICIPEGINRSSQFYNCAPSLMFTAMSRVKTFQGLAFTQPFRRELVNNPSSNTNRMWLKEEQRLRELEAEM